MGVTIIAILQLLAALAQIGLGAIQIMGGLAIPIIGMILVTGIAAKQCIAMEPLGLMQAY